MGAPEAADSLYRFCPLGSKPAGFMKPTKLIVPTLTTAAELGWVTETTPSAEMLTPLELAGLVMLSLRAKPEEVTKRPKAST